MRVHGPGRYGARAFLVLLAIRTKHETGLKNMGKVRPHIGLRKRMTGTGNERKNDMIQACERGARIAAESRVSNIMCK